MGKARPSFRGPQAMPAPVVTTSRAVRRAAIRRPTAAAAAPGELRSAVEGLVWPALPPTRYLPQLSLQFQLEQSQWWPPERLLAHQLRQLQALLRHAAATTPYYRALFARIGFDAAAPLSLEDWRRLPLLSRRDLQEHNAALRSEAPPAAHGATHEGESSGSTGMPVRVLSSQLQQLLWQAGTLREHLWHRRDFSRRLAIMRNVSDPGAARYPTGAMTRNWGPATSAFVTGPAFLLRLSTPVDQQIEWLIRIAPDYVLSYPSNLEALAKRCLERDTRLPGLRQLRTISEVLRSEVRDLCREAFGVEIIDLYSAMEIGNIAFQSPASTQLLAQAETAMVEIVDEQGRACGPGEVGSVVVTPLHGFAMPLIRYAIGDHAEAGGRAACGRGLPVIERVLGRLRNMVRLPDGRVFYPLYTNLMRGLDKVIQFQIVRRAVTVLEVRLVTRAPLEAGEEAELKRRVRERFQYPFEVSLVYCDTIPRTRSGKFLDYVSALPEDAAP